MNAQSQAPNQSLGQVSRMAQPNGSSLPGSAPQVHRTWHQEADVFGLRRTVVENILSLFQKRRGPVTQEWQQKLPDFVKKLEEGLYRQAASKEEYADPTTLESRLQSLAKRKTKATTHMSNQLGSHGNVSSSSLGNMENMIPTPGVASTMIPTPGSTGNLMPGPSGVSTMVPTPGVASNMVPTPGVASNMLIGNMIPTPGHGHANSSVTGMNNMMVSSGKTNMMSSSSSGGTMMPTPGHSSMMYNNTGVNMMPTPGTTGSTLVSQQGMGGMRMSQNGNMGMSMGMPAGGSQMIPTPGLTPTQAMGMNQPSSSGLVLPNVTSGSVPQQSQPQSFGGVSGNQMYRSMNGQIGGSLNNMVQQRKNALGTISNMNNGVPMIGNTQHLMNGSSAIHSQSSHLNSNQFSGLQAQPQSQQQQQRIQNQRQLRMQPPVANPMVSVGEGYAMNAADLAGPGTIYPPVSSGGSLNHLSTNGSHSQKMIPVPGLPPSQQNASQQHLQQNSQAQQLQNLQRNNPAANPAVSRAQHQVLVSKSQGLYQSMPPPSLSTQKPHSGNVSQEQTQHQSPTQKVPMPAGRSLYDSQPSSPQLQRQQPVALHQQMNMQGQPQQRQAAMQQQQTSSLSQQGRQQMPQAQHQSQQQPESSSLSQQQATVKTLSQPNTVQQTRTPQQSQQRSFMHTQQLQQRPQAQAQSSQQDIQAQPISSALIDQQQVPQNQPQVQQTPMNSQSPQLNGPSNGAVPPVQTVRTGNNPNGALPSGQLRAGAAGSIDPQRAQQYSKQQRWLLFLRHASKCTATEGHCNISPHCHMARQLWTHLGSCREKECTYTRCNASRTLLHHYRICNDQFCPVCGPVKTMINKRPHASTMTSIGNHGSPGTVSSPGNIGGAVGPASSGGALPTLSSSIEFETQGPPKRMKTEPGTVPGTSCTNPQQNPAAGPVKTSATASASSVAQQGSNRHASSVKIESSTLCKIENSASTSKVESQGSFQPMPVSQRQTQVKVECSTQVKVEATSGLTLAGNSVKVEPAPPLPPVKQEALPAGAASAIVPVSAAKSGKPKIVGTSLTELFTPEQIREHITGLRQWVGQSKAKAEKNQAMEHQMSENACRLCAVEKLTFEPPPIYCTSCGARIKRNAPFYTAGSGETRHYSCIPCYNDIRTETVEMDGIAYPKSKLEKRKNDEETEEAWVQCDKCNQWNHQVCALFNGRRNEGGEAEYTCPQCCMLEIERGERKPLLSSAVLGAKDLPKTFLSDHLEQRLARKLKQERIDRARAQGKSVDEVPGAEALVIRVVSNVDKKLEVKSRFLEIFQEEDYPTEFPYKSKVVLLFQKIEGVEVCLFGMYVQEFGVECSPPNQRRVYLSYLDSVKYFRPDVRTSNNEALRTFVYHEILIAYLDYCKLRGFSSCYIWACPPLKGEDYILYCHPEIQKTPKSDKLRDWYLTMLKKATGDGIVAEVTNLYDHFFTSTGECRSKVTAARLPYFDGDYWPGAAEDMIVQLQQEEEDGRKLQKKGKNKKTATKRASKAAAQAELASNASKDMQLMYKLGESILPMKEDFIMVHLHYCCTHCRNFIISGWRWTCKQCKSFNLCDRCHDAEQKREEKDRHPITSKEAHPLTPAEVEKVPADTKDKDEFMESEFFDTRQAFLSLCQGNHYQYDTLRRAKHSSMMVLYHLHNPTAPAFVITCNVCLRDIETGQGWRCETCPDFDLCNNCKDGAKHQHKLTPHPSASERNAQNKEARQQRVLQLRKMLDLLVHASQCGVPSCSYPKCRSVKGLFRHGMMCKVRASGGCALCKRMWYLLQLHARACKESECRVPRCKDLKEHVRRSNQQQESRRRAAVMEMMRQRAAEAAGAGGYSAWTRRSLSARRVILHMLKDLICLPRRSLLEHRDSDSSVHPELDPLKD
ncbi:hypothetical protein R1flu_009730 [Riccia fluitans]|uniref:histone acetyltransferase n=1 Tax=Riccia fluitans TaxID=41844 RepID=A0ABD1Z327_9MARC